MKYFTTSLIVTHFLIWTGISTAQTYDVPEILYYKFENNGPSNTPNYAIPGNGLNPASIFGLSLGIGGEFDSALIGNGGSSTSNYLNSGWNIDFNQSSWTICFWIGNYPPGVFGYLFGPDFTSSFRCFSAGISGSGNVGLRGMDTLSFREVDILGVLPGPSVVHIVYDSATSMMRTYVNGFLQDTVTQHSLNLSSTVPLKVGAYGSAASMAAGGRLDEFRVYRRALDSAEIAATWNQTLPYTVTSVQQTSGIAEGYRLSQNYPNPFNPETRIEFSVPKSGYVSLRVFNLLGQEVKELVNEELSAGSYSVNFNAGDHSSGVYYYTLTTDGFTQTKKMLLVK